MAGASTDEERRLIRVSKTETPKWLTQNKVFELMSRKVHFMDITDHSVPSPRKYTIRGPGKL